MRVVADEDLIITSFIAGQTGDSYTVHNGTIGVLDRHGRILGGFVFTQYTGPGMEMTMAGRGCVSRTAWQAVGDYVYGTMGCMRLSCTTRRSNKRVRRMAPRFGMKFEGVARKYYGAEDGLQFSLLRDEAIRLGYWKESR